MNYSEAAYFDGAHVQHIADWQERQRLSRIAREAGRLALRDDINQRYANTLNYLATR